MIYVYQLNGQWAVNRDKAPEGVDYIELKRMIPTPVKAGFDAKLNANLETGMVWFDLVENIEGARARKIAEIEAYDSGDAVNQFTIGGVPMWLTRDERASLKIRFEAEMSAGRTDTVLRYAGMSIPLKITDGLGMLIMLELYAADCFDTTQNHLDAVRALETAEAINAYDYTTGYPAKPEL